MTVLEAVRKYDLADMAKSYRNVFGKAIPFMNLDKLAQMQVKEVYINLRSNVAEITLLTYDNE